MGKHRSALHFCRRRRSTQTGEACAYSQSTCPSCLSSKGKGNAGACANKGCAARPLHADACKRMGWKSPKAAARKLPPLLSGTARSSCCIGLQACAATRARSQKTNSTLYARARPRVKQESVCCARALRIYCTPGSFSCFSFPQSVRHATTAARTSVPRHRLPHSKIAKTIMGWFIERGAGYPEGAAPKAVSAKAFISGPAA